MAIVCSDVSSAENWIFGRHGSHLQSHYPPVERRIDVGGRHRVQCFQIVECGAIESGLEKVRHFAEDGEELARERPGLVIQVPIEGFADKETLGDLELRRSHNLLAAVTTL